MECAGEGIASTALFCKKSCRAGKSLISIGFI
jgi:hypothetical protein